MNLNKGFYILCLCAIITLYLVFTGVKSTMTYYVTPSELISDTTLYNIGVRVGARVVPGSLETINGINKFIVQDLLDEDVMFQVIFNDPLPNTFTDTSEVVLDGIFINYEFHATTVLTKCGSRYESDRSRF